MYNIKEAAARAGVSVPVLRAWERRYGVVRPPRTTAGYRQFDDATVARVRTMRTLVDQGWAPSAAAAAIVAGAVPLVLDAGATASERAAGDDPSAGPADDLGARFVRAARDLDAAALEPLLDDLFSRGSFEHVAARLLFPTLRRLGEAWAAAEVSVAGEHLASAAILRRLGQAFEGAGRPLAGAPRIVVGLPPGGRHELGALAFAVAARRAGLAVTYVGPDLPVADWVIAAAGADGAVVGVVTARDRRAALDVARELRSAHPGLLVVFGGAAAPESSEVLRLPASLADAVASLSAALGRPAA